MAIAARRGKKRPKTNRHAGALAPKTLPGMEVLESREMMDVGLNAAASWYINVACQKPPASVFTDETPGTRGAAIMPTVHLTPGWATFGQALPEGAAYEELQVGDLPTQTDVKTRWNDGSIKFAVVSAHVQTAGDYTLSASGSDAGTFTPDSPGVSIWFYQDQQWYGAWAYDMDWSDRWLDGPLVAEGRHNAPLYSYPSFEPHPSMRVLFDVRSYADGTGEVDIAVENTLDQAGEGMQRYDVWIINDDGTDRDYLFQQSGVEHAYLSRWRYQANLGLNESRVTPDFEPAFQANALPRYLPVVTNEVPGMGGRDFEILGPGSLNRDMEAHGGRPEIAPYPDWTARYLAHRGADQKDYVLAHGDLAGSWPIHVRESDGRMVSIDERPNYWLDDRATPGNKPAGDLNGRNFYNPFTDEGMTPDNAHQPSLAYVPYLVTGDRYYADEMAYWANYVLLYTWQDTFYNARGGSLGLLEPNQVRGIGWGLRNLVDAAAYLPDADPMKAYFTEKVYNNLNALDDYATRHQNPLGTLWEHKRLENQWPIYNEQSWIAPWENNYVAWAIDHANKQGFEGGLLHRNRIARWQLALFNNPATRDGAAPYIAPIGQQVPAGSMNIRHYTDVTEVYQGPTQFQGYYGTDARLMLLIGKENGWAGAQQAYDYLNPLLAEEVYQLGVSDLALRAGWAVAE